MVQPDVMHLKLPTLKFRRLRGDMIEVFKIIHNIYDERLSPHLPFCIIRGIINFQITLFTM